MVSHYLCLSSEWYILTANNWNTSSIGFNSEEYSSKYNNKIFFSFQKIFAKLLFSSIEWIDVLLQIKMWPDVTNLTLTNFVIKKLKAVEVP